MVIQSPIDRLSVNFIQATLVNEPLEIIATMYSDVSSVLFQWDYGDGSDLEYGTDSELTTYHSYNRYVGNVMYFSFHMNCKMLTAN